MFPGFGGTGPGLPPGLPPGDPGVPGLVLGFVPGLPGFGVLMFLNGLGGLLLPPAAVAPLVVL